MASRSTVSVVLTGKVVAKCQCGHHLSLQTGDLVSISAESSSHLYLYCRMSLWPHLHQCDPLLKIAQESADLESGETEFNAI